MIIGGSIGRPGAGNVIYGEGDAVIPIGNVAFIHITLSIAPRNAGDCAAGTVAPNATDSGIGHEVMVGVVHSDSHSGGPCTALTGARSIQVADMHNGRCWC